MNKESIMLTGKQKQYLKSLAVQLPAFVQIGKEGWDCRSLTGVILSQQGDCPKNMVLQTSCRCLRQVERGKTEEAIIWLNKYYSLVWIGSL